MKKYVNLFVFVFMIGACLSQGRAQTKSAVSYKNPVVDIAMPDPTVIKAQMVTFMCMLPNLPETFRS